MSLLMQALKKAEHAKKQAAPAADQVQQGTPTTEFPTLEDVRLEEMPEHPTRLEPILSAPDTPLPAPVAFEIEQVRVELAPAPPAAEILTPAPAIQMAEKISPAPATSPEKPARQTPQLAQTVFSAKQAERPSRVVFLGGVAVALVLLTLAAYYYWQSTMIDPVIVPQMRRPMVPTVPIMPTVSESDPVKNPLSVQEHPAFASGKTAQRIIPTEEAEPDPAPRSEQAALLVNANKIRISKGTAISPTNTLLQQAFQEFSNGNIDAAADLYGAALRKEGSNRDAMLGLAAIALKRNQPEQAAAYYSKLLDMNPTDPDATAGLISVQRGDPSRNESQLKKILAQNPHSAPNLFELGNLYAQQSRWPEAQDAYFRAYEAAPDNADYAYNLAIGLDRLAQPRLALDYYQRALVLSKTKPGNFDLNAAQNRIKQLQTE
ncbi:tetratricopeptide (TPR) repeat protein [Oxalobacteraceae bacterium GrIS 2.11]